jgi:hypothetical protein
VSQGQKQQIQHGVQQQQQQDTQNAKQHLPPDIAQKIPANGSAKLNPNTHTVTIKNPAKGSTVIVDSNTGKVGLSYTKAAGRAQTRPSNGITKQVSGPVTIEKGPSGYQHVIDTSKGTESTSYRGFHSDRTTRGNTTIINKTVIVNNQKFVISQDRPFVRTFNPYDGGYYNMYRPSWWGRADYMDDHWQDGRHHVYGEFFAYGGYNQPGYISPWWAPGNGFVSWEDRPLQWDRWDHYYDAWHWGWRAENYYPGFYNPMSVYPSFGYWIADYYYQRELETEREERLAAEEYEDYVAQEQQQWADNAPAIEQIDEPVTQDILDLLAYQAETMVNAIREGVELYASNVMDDGHLFTADETMDESATIDGNSYNCELKPGDLITRDENFDLDVEPVLDADGNPQVDDYGNVITTTYVPMKVVASKRHSCVRGSTVVVQLDSLQSMLDEERARVQEGMEYGITLEIHP